MDALSDVLRAVRLTGAVFFDVKASDPWVAETPAGQTIVRNIFPDADHLMSYHAVTRGSCWACPLDGEPIRLTAGDVVVFPHGDAHVLSSDPALEAESSGRKLLLRMGPGNAARVKMKLRDIRDRIAKKPQ